MAKSIIIFLFILLAVLLGCSAKQDIKQNVKRDIKPDYHDSISQKKDIKENLSDIEEAYPDYDYQAPLDKYSGQLPDNISITKFRYFVVISDLDESLTYKLIDNDIRITVEAMADNFTSKSPDNVTPIFLFNDYEAYKNFSLKNFDIDERDLSQYGFYKISKNVIVIRYVNWKGSLMHELTHRLLRSDFPDIPSWFDEGFASLNEKAAYKNGELIGEFSWRILAIRRAIEENRHISLEKLMEFNDSEFYGKYSSYHYAMGRFLLMYLQEKGLLKDYYMLYKETFSRDKSGISQLEKILNKPIEQIDEDFLEYIKSFKQ